VGCELSTELDDTLEIGHERINGPSPEASRVRLAST
jgi:hypothetical protein